jgi:beta-glucanase (GH16 family)
LALGVVGVVLSALVTTFAASLPSASAATAQRGTTSLTAPIVQPGRGVASANRARLSGTVRFRPVRRGRHVLVQRRAGSGAWDTVARERENGAGKVWFTAAAHDSAGTPYTYRGVALRGGGLPRFAANQQSADVWSLKFTDQFNESSFAADGKWTDRPSQSSSRKCAKAGDRRARSISNGTLNLKVKLNPNRRGDVCRTAYGRFRYYLNGEVATSVPNAFTRGTFAARIKFEKHRGQHGGFWMQPVHGQCLAGHPAKSGAEIDVAEFFGKGYRDGGLGSFVYNYGIHCGQTKIGAVSRKATAMLPRHDSWWTRYHVLSLAWTKHSYIFRVDGRQHYRTSRGVSGIDEYLILSLLSSDWELAQAKKLGIKPGGTMHVDWARVWQK